MVMLHGESAKKPVSLPGAAQRKKAIYEQDAEKMRRLVW
jgi:hypothetical protein